MIALFKVLLTLMALLSLTAARYPNYVSNGGKLSIKPVVPEEFILVPSQMQMDKDASEQPRIKRRFIVRVPLNQNPEFRATLNRISKAKAKKPSTYSLFTIMNSSL